MKKYILFTIIGFFTLLSFSQNNGITYQAVIYNPNAEQLPGYDDQLSPMVESDICLRFSIYGQGLEYEETVQTTTDKFGMVNIIIGNNDQTGGSANSFSDIDWDSGQSSMRVELDNRGNCVDFEEISYQAFSYVPFAYYAQNDASSAAIEDNLDLIIENQLAINQNESDAGAAIAALQADVDQNESDGDETDAALQSNIDTAVANATEAITNNAIANATTQADVDQNEADADAAIAALQTDVDGNEADSDTAEAANAAAIAALQADVDGNESDSDTANAALQADVDSNEAAIEIAEAANASAIAALQADVDGNEADSDTADTTMQADVDQNEADADAAIAALEASTVSNAGGTFSGSVVINGNLTVLGGTTSGDTAAAIESVQADVDTNEADADAAIAALQADVDGNEADSDTADTTMQADIDLNEADADAAIAALQADVDGNEADSDLADTTMQGYIDINEANADAAITSLDAAIAALQADVDGNESDSDTANTALQADVDANEAATVKLTGDQTVNGVKTFNSDLLARLRGNVRTTNADGAVSLILNANVGSDSPAVFTGNVDGTLGNDGLTQISNTGNNQTTLNIFSEFNSIYIGSNPSATTVTTGTPVAKNNISLGKVTLSKVTTGDKNTAIGLAALKELTTGYNNNAVGYQAGKALTTGFNNDMFGFQAGTKVTTGQENVVIGKQAGFNLSTGKWNVFVGKSAGSVIQTGQSNTMIGNGANVTGGNTGAVNRTAIGSGAIASTNNTVVLGNTNAANQLWVGTDKQGDVYATNGIFSGTVTGNIQGNVTGNFTGNLTGDVTGNVTGDVTGNADTASALSVAIGLNDLSDAISDSSNNLVLGAGSDITSGQTNVTLLGPGIPDSDYSNSIVLGNSDISYIFGGYDWGAQFYGGGFFNVSDRRFKNNIRPLESTLEFLSNIKGKRYDMKDGGKSEIGLIAQEIKEYYPSLVVEKNYMNTGEKRMAVNYAGFVPILINAINEQQEIIEELQSKVDEIEILKQEIQMIKDMINN